MIRQIAAGRAEISISCCTLRNSGVAVLRRYALLVR